MEAVKIPIFACVMIISSVKASELMNNDIVKPIEAKKLIPNRLRRFIPSGNGAMRSFTSNQVIPTIPITLPAKSPSDTPSATFVLKSSCTSTFIETPALASAKIGSTINVTIGCMACSRR